jgi:hypothetical protein
LVVELQLKVWDLKSISSYSFIVLASSMLKMLSFSPQSRSIFCSAYK